MCRYTTAIRTATEITLTGFSYKDVLTLESLRVISIKFLVVISMPCKTEWS